MPISDKFPKDEIIVLLLAKPMAEDNIFTVWKI